MGVVVVLLEEMHVISGDHANPELLAQGAHAVRDAPLPRFQVAEVGYGLGRDRLASGDSPRALALAGRMDHNLQRVVVAEEPLIPAGDLLGLRRVVAALQSVVKVVCHLAGDAGRRAMKPLVVLLQQGVVDSRIVVVAVYVRLGYELHEVVVANQVLRVQAEVEALLLYLLVLLEVRMAQRMVAGRSDVRLDAEYGLDSVLAALVVERLQGEQVSVVGHGQGRHAHGLCLCDKRLDLALPVQQRIRRMKMKVYEVGHGDVL